VNEVGAGGNKYFSLKRLEFGDLRDYRFDPEESWRSIVPLVFAKSTGAIWRRDYSGIGGKQGIQYNVRVVHVWNHDQCRDVTSGQWVSPARSRCQRMKKLNQACFQGATRKLDDPTLTTADSGVTASLSVVRFVGSYLEGIEDLDLLPGRYYGVAVDLEVITVTF
jgi:hypothetical protein